jgi:dipeptidyl aminopeptidase/acylaminoacyl peptidase
MRLSMLAAIALCAASPAFGQVGPRRPFALTDLGQMRQPYLTQASPDGNVVVFVLGDSLYVRDTRGGGTRPLVDSMSNQITYQRPAIAWSPRGDYLLVRRGAGGRDNNGTFVVVDVRTGRHRPLLPDTLNAQLRTFLHWAMAAPSWSPDGKRIAFVAAHASSDTRLKLFVADVARRDAEVWATDVLPFGGIAAAQWSPDGKWLAVTSGAFGGDAGKVTLLPAVGERTERVLLKGGSPMYRDPAWSGDSRYLAITAHNGRKFVIEPGAEGSPVVAPKLKLSSYAGWLSDENALLGTVRSGMSARLAKENPITGELVLLSGPDTLFTAIGATSRGMIITAESGTLPQDVWRRTVDGAMTRITRTNAWTDSVAMPRASIYRWRSAKGDTLEAQLFLPTGTASNARVPLVVLPYGGYSNEFPRSEYFLSAGIPLLAAQGYAVVRPNTRDVGINGAMPGYGRVQLEDTELLVSSLHEAGVVDRARVAAIGHSHGGALAYYFLTHSQSFCAVAPVNGWSDWSEIAERVGGTDSTRPEILKQASPLLNAAAVTTPLLAVSGASDAQVLPHNAARMVDALRALGKPAALLHFPDEGHLIDKPANRTHFWQTVVSFLKAHCT